MGCGASHPAALGSLGEATPLPVLRKSLAAASPDAADPQAARVQTLIAAKQELKAATKQTPRPDGKMNRLRLSEIVSQLTETRRRAAEAGAYGGAEAEALSNLLSLYEALALDKEAMASAVASAASASSALEVGQLRAVVAETLAPVLAQHGTAAPASKTVEATALRARIEEVRGWVATKEEVAAATAGASVARSETSVVELRAAVKRMHDAEARGISTRGADPNELEQCAPSPLPRARPRRLTASPRPPGR